MAEFTPDGGPEYAQPVDRGTVINGTSEWERTYGLFTHLSGAAYFLGLPILLTLVLWLIKRDQSRFVDACGKSSMNMQLTLYLAAFICGALGFITCGSAWLLLPVIAIYQIVISIIAALKVRDGINMRYPLTIPFFTV